MIEPFRKVLIAYELVLVREMALGEQEDRKKKTKRKNKQTRNGSKTTQKPSREDSEELKYGLTVLVSSKFIFNLPGSPCAIFSSVVRYVSPSGSSEDADLFIKL